jgi:hypothetical protein
MIAPYPPTGVIRPLNSLTLTEPVLPFFLPSHETGISNHTKIHRGNRRSRVSANPRNGNGNPSFRDCAHRCHNHGRYRQSLERRRQSKRLLAERSQFLRVPRSVERRNQPDFSNGTRTVGVVSLLMKVRLKEYVLRDARSLS